MPFCNNCGQPLADNAKFCGSCGAVVTPAAAEPAQPAYQAAHSEQPFQPVQPVQSEPERPDYSAPAAPEDTGFHQSPPQTGYQPQPNLNGGNYVPPEQPPKKKSKTGLIIGIAAAAVVIIAAIVLIVFLGKGTNFTGYWECDSIDDGSGKPFDEYYGMDTEDLFAFVLNDDNTFTMVMFGDESVDGTWTSAKKSVSMTAEGDTITLAYEREKLVMDLSEDGETLILYFELAGRKAPRGFGEAASDPVPPTDTPVDEPTDKPAEDPTDNPTNVPVVAGELGDEASYNFGDFSVEILGGQPCYDDYTDNCFRVYYRFTNNSNAPTSSWMELYTYGFQGETELDTDWISDDTPEDYYYYLDIMPGTSIICTEIFELSDDSPLEFYICEDWDVNKKECATAVFDVTADTAAGISYEFVPVPDPTWTVGMTDEITWDDLYVFIDSAETASSWDGDNDLIRVYFNWTNNTDGATSFWMETTVTVFQDDVELFSGYADESVVSDDMFDANIEPGESKTVSNCYELRSESPVVVLVYNTAADEYIGCTFFFN